MIGYGTEIHPSNEAYRTFFQNNEYYTIRCGGEHVLRWMKKNSQKNIKDAFYDSVFEGTDDPGIGGLAAAIMTHKTGVRFEYRWPSIDGEDPVIIIPQRFPWDMTKQEKLLDKESIEDFYCRNLSALISGKKARVFEFSC